MNNGYSNRPQHASYIFSKWANLVRKYIDREGETLLCVTMHTDLDPWIHFKGENIYFVYPCLSCTDGTNVGGKAK